MTGPEHYREAERLLSQASHEGITGTPVTHQGMPMRPEVHAALIARAQVHAQLALTAAMAMPGAYYGEEGVTRDQRAWDQAIRSASQPNTTKES